MRILFFIFFFTIYSFHASSEIVNDVITNNNKRISKESIISLGSIKFGNDYDQSDLDAVLKNLYETDFFSDIKIYNLVGKTLFLSILYFLIAFSACSVASNCSFARALKV